MKVALCSHIQADETPCRAVAIRNRPRCLAHQSLHQRTQRQQRSFRPPEIRLRSLHRRDFIARAALRVARAIAHGTIALDRAAALMYRIQVADCNLELEQFPARINPAARPSPAKGPLPGQTAANLKHAAQAVRVWYQRIQPAKRWRTGFVRARQPGLTACFRHNFPECLHPEAAVPASNCPYLRLLQETTPCLPHRTSP
jgi:hypothetical protein